MLNTKNTQSEIAVRLYDNQKFGTTYGKGLYRKAIYNGTVDAKHSGIKYLVDFYTYEDWANQAKTDEQMSLLKDTPPIEDTLFSWVKYFDSSTQTKSHVMGVCLLNLETMEIRVGIVDLMRGVEDVWQLTAHRCRQSEHGKRSPQLLATNGDLHDW
jgi:hypothetical protein